MIHGLPNSSSGLTVKVPPCGLTFPREFHVWRSEQEEEKDSRLCASNVKLFCDVSFNTYCSGDGRNAAAVLTIEIGGVNPKPNSSQKVTLLNSVLGFFLKLLQCTRLMKHLGGYSLWVAHPKQC
jgi:hypothetical protein